MIGTDAEIGLIFKRLEKLEKTVFSGRAPHKEFQKPKTFDGLKGGIELLISQNYLKDPHTAPDIKEKLTSHDYRYSIAAIQTTLNSKANPPTSVGGGVWGRRPHTIYIPPTKLVVEWRDAKALSKKPALGI